MPQRRRRPRLLCTSGARPIGGFLMATAGQPRQCYQRSMRNPARASRSFNSVIRLSLAGTMFATVVKRRWSSLTARHGWFGCAVRGLLHGGETCRVRVAERRRAPRTLSCHFAVCLQCHAGRHSALPAVSVHPALRVGISGAEMISQAEGSTAVKVSVVPRSRQHETTSGRRERTWIQQQLASPVVLSGIRVG